MFGISAQAVAVAVDRRLVNWQRRFYIQFGSSSSQPLLIKQLLEKNTSLAGPGALAHYLQRCTAYKIQNGRQWATKWLAGSENMFTPWILGAPFNSC